MTGDTGQSMRAGSPRETQLVVALAAFAFLRVFVFASVLPFFNGIDEHLHFDLLQKYSRGFLPGPEPATLDAVTVGLLAAHGSPEYLKGPEAFENGRIPTPEETSAKRPPGSAAHRKLVAWYTQWNNFEAEGPPTYYVLGGAWLKLGRTIGLQEIQLLYWVRWLNPMLAAAVVAATYAFLRRRCPGDAFRRLGPCIFLAGYPNDLNYGVTADVLSIGLGALCFFGLVRMREAPRSLLVAIATGFGHRARIPQQVSERALRRGGVRSLRDGAARGAPRAHAASGVGALVAVVAGSRRTGRLVARAQSACRRKPDRRASQDGDPGLVVPRPRPDPRAPALRSARLVRVRTDAAAHLLAGRVRLARQADARHDRGRDLRDHLARLRRRRGRELASRRRRGASVAACGSRRAARVRRGRRGAGGALHALRLRRRRGPALRAHFPILRRAA